jgi:carboxymethylenebutenolidase
MGQRVEVRRPDGGSCPAYLNAELAPDSAPGLVVIQEWWGLNEQIQQTADRFAQAGYRVIVPDLFRGKHAANVDEASHMMDQLNFIDASEQDIQGCVDHLRQDSTRCGVTGFCMGGALTILSALRVSGLDAAGCFYGIPPKDFADPGQIRLPMIFHFANIDNWCTPQLVDGLEEAMKRSESEFELYRYDAQHAFMNDAGPAYDAASADLAWKRTLDFFERRLKGGS